MHSRGLATYGRPPYRDKVGLAATGNIDYSWNSFENAFKNGIFFNARRK
jgi:hypothetical protein